MQQADQFPATPSTADRMNQNSAALFEVNASAFVAATPQQAWQVLTDYERLTEFVPDLVRSKVLSRGQHDATLEQESKASFLFLSRTIQMVVHIREQPYSALEVTLVSGDMRQYRAHWSLAAATQQGRNGTLITYSGSMEPAFFVPPLVGRPLVQANVQKMVSAVVTEIERRSAP